MHLCLVIIDQPSVNHLGIGSCIELVTTPPWKSLLLRTTSSHVSS